MSVTFRYFGGILTVLSTNRDQYALGEPVRISLTKINISNRPINLIYSTSQRYDFLVYTSAAPIWQWSYDRVFLPVVREVVLLPGQSHSYSEIWPQLTNQGTPVPPGLYQLTGWNTADNLVFLRPSVLIRIGRNFGLFGRIEQ